MTGDRDRADRSADWDLPEQTADDRDVGWGDDLPGGDGSADADDDSRLRADRPPHHEDRDD